jgi:integrase
MKAIAIQRIIEQFTPGQKQRKKITGNLYIKQSPGGKLSWEYRYGKTILLGKVDVADLDESYKMACRLVAKQEGLRAEGRDPVTVRQAAKMEKYVVEQRATRLKAQIKDEAERDLRTVEVVAKAWWDDYKAPIAETRKRIWDDLKNHVFPQIGAQPIHAVSHMTIWDNVYMPLIAEQPETVRKLFQRLNMIWQYAAHREWVPAYVIERSRGELKRKLAEARQNKPSRHLNFLPYAEMGEMLRAIYAAPENSWRNVAIATLLTVKRPGQEVAQAQWDEFDFENAVWTIPSARMKRKKQGGGHQVPLSRQALAFFKDLYDRRVSKYVFPAIESPSQPVRDHAVSRFMQLLGYADRHHIHGSRSSFSTHANEHKMGSEWDAEIIELALDHLPEVMVGSDGRAVKSNNVRMIYNNATYMAPRRALLQWWADELDRARRDHIKLVA